jgi:two-component sensor histidine kinase
MMLEDLYRLLKAGHVQAQGVVDTMTQPIIVLDQGLCVSTANNAFLKIFKVERDDVLGQAFFALGNRQWDIPDLRVLLASVIPKSQAIVGFEVKHDFPDIGQRAFLVDARRLVHPDDNSSSILVLFDDVTEQQRHDADKDLIVSETLHRMKNQFAVVRSLAMQTKVEGRTAAEYRDHFVGRLDATLHAQEIAATAETTDLEALIKQSVGEAGAHHLHCKGPSALVPSAKIVPITMIFHELTTNSLKYGALSAPDGRIQIKWSLDKAQEGPTQLQCTWLEENGPPVTSPKQKGFGTELIRRMALQMGGSAEQKYDPNGLVAMINFPL